MGKDLVIVESPTKARTLGRILGSDATVLASNGHIRDLPEKKLGIDLRNGFEPQYETPASRRKIITALTKAAKDADAIYLATDPDREGEAIAWHLAELLDSKQEKIFHRVTFHEITRSAVMKAFEHPHQVNMNLVNAQQARRVLDRLVGYQVSPLLWNRIERGTSAGRVQSVALRLICEREAEVDAFEPQEYWNMTATFSKAGDTAVFSSKLHRLDGDKVEIDNGELAGALAAEAERAQYTVAEVSRTPRQRRPQPPFITSTLQQAASSNLRFSTDQTMRIAQQLYEGIDTGSGPAGLITYMRTDSVNVAKEAQDAARAYVTQRFGDAYVPDKPNVYKSGKAAQEAHEAIRPTDIELTPELAAPFLDERQLRLYTLIWNRFLASQMAVAQTLIHAIELENRAGTSSHTFRFRSSVTTITFDGYLKVYNLSDVEGDVLEEDAAIELPPLQANDACDLHELLHEQKFTEPPPLYSEAMLVRELERNGIGRPSTYAGIVRTIKQREYVDKRKGKLRPTKLGLAVNAYLVERMPQLFNVNFTAQMEDALDTVEQGDHEWHQMLEKFYGDFVVWLDQAKSLGGPADAAVKRLMQVFPADLDWRPPEKVGRRTYDDKKFFTSLQDQLKRKKAFSDRQWLALIKLAVTYEEQLQGFALAAEELDLGEQVEEFREKRRAADEASKQEPDEADVRLCQALAGVGEWEEPVKRGRRVYDDKKFHRSLQGQVEGGRQLSAAQRRALTQLALKYRNQIADYDEIRDLLQVPEPETTPEQREEILSLLAISGLIKEWPEPTTRGRRRFDEQEFVRSVAEQFEQKQQLSDRQVSALKKVIYRHRDQITDYEERVSNIDMAVASRKSKRQAAEEPAAS